MAARSRLPLALGAAAAGGIGYYLYSAGGSPRVAEKQFESDVHRASAKIKEHAPWDSHNNSPISTSSSESAEKQGARVGKEVGGKIDSAVNALNRDLSKAKHETEAYAKQTEAFARQTKADALRKIDEFDRTVEEKAAKSKSYLSSWFGGGGK